MHRTSDQSRFHATPRVLDACFDVGGSELHLYLVMDGRKLQKCIANRTEEIEQLLIWLGVTAKFEGYSNVRVVVEATGVYHELLLRMARMRGMETCFVSAEAASKNRVVLFGDTGKTDKRDPVAIADLAARGIVLRDRDLSDDFSALRCAGALYARAEKSGIGVPFRRYPHPQRPSQRDRQETTSNLVTRTGSPTGTPVPVVRPLVPGSSGRHSQAEGTTMTIVVLRVIVIRNCGPGKQRADSKSGVLRAFPTLMNLPWSKVFDHLEELTVPFFGASPDRFALGNPSALD